MYNFSYFIKIRQKLNNIPADHILSYKKNLKILSDSLKKKIDQKLSKITKNNKNCKNFTKNDKNCKNF